MIRDQRSEMMYVTLLTELCACSPDISSETHMNNIFNFFVSNLSADHI